MATASALSRSGASTEPRYSPRLRMMTTRQLRSLAGFFEREGESARGRAGLFFLDDQRGLVRRELKQVPLPGLPHSTEFMDAYQTALVTEHREEINAQPHRARNHQCIGRQLLQIRCWEERPRRRDAQDVASRN